VLDIYDLFSKSEPVDVRWEKVKQFKRILTNGAYSVPPEQVAARLIERMVERGRSHFRRRHCKQSSKTDDT
jgi:Anti-sigma-28 factor, FlgM